MRIRHASVCLVLSAVALGCGPDGSDGTPESSVFDDFPFAGDTAGAGEVFVDGTGGFGGGFAGGFAPFPDQTPPEISAVPPKPIQGGTLLVTADGSMAVAADPDRDRIVVVDILNGGVYATFALQDGADPGRVIQDASGRVHVALRGSGELVSLDLGTREIADQRAVCGVPQGLAYDAAQDAVLVACTGGELVTMPASGGEAMRVTLPARDLRDVIVTPTATYVTTFKSAELLQLDADGTVVARTSPDTLTGELSSPLSGTATTRTLAPAVAWRTLATPSGEITMLHQRAQVDAIDIGLAVQEDPTQAPDGGAEPMQAPDAGVDNCESCGGDCCLGMPPPPPDDFFGTGAGYGAGPSSCSGIVESGVTHFGPDGARRTVPPILGAVLPVDAAVSPDGQWLAVAAAGAFQETSLLGFMNPSADGLGVMVIPVDDPGMNPGECLAPGLFHSGSMLGTGQAVAVAFDSGGRLVVQTRDPNRLRIYDTATCSLGCAPELDVALGGEPRRDTGHDLFHLDAGAGLACASCHPGGGDDGHTWSFLNLGPRRTQLFTMGLHGTEPLHWDGDLATFQDLVDEVFVHRMGGAPQTPERAGALDNWMATLSPLPSLRASNDAAALRGKALFESDEVGCASCHNGEKLTNNMTVDVGTGGAFQVPSLINVVYHQPYIHTGCAKTLRERFDPECGGGDAHGHTSQLAEGQLDDLVAYLETL